MHGAVPFVPNLPFRDILMNTTILDLSIWNLCAPSHTCVMEVPFFSNPWDGSSHACPTSGEIIHCRYFFGDICTIECCLPFNPFRESGDQDFGDHFDPVKSMSLVDRLLSIMALETCGFFSIISQIHKGNLDHASGILKNYYVRL